MFHGSFLFISVVTDANRIAFLRQSNSIMTVIINPDTTINVLLHLD